MKKQPPKLLYGLLATLGLLIASMVVARSAGWVGVTERLSVDTATVQRRNLSALVSERGVVRAVQEVVVRSELAGQIQELLVTEGDTVVAGQLLAVLRPDRAEVELARAQAVVNQRRAQWAEARAQATRAQAQRQQAVAAYYRAHWLHRQRVIPDAEWEQVQAQYRSARQDHRAAQQRAEAARHTVAEAEAQTRQQQHNVTLTRLYAPRRGTVVKLAVAEGERVAATSTREGTELLRIADLQHLEIQLEIEEADMLMVAVGQSAIVRLDALPNQPLAGTVTHLAYQSTATDFGQNAFRVHVTLGSPPASLRLGMNARVNIVTESRTQTLTVPLLAVDTRPLLEPTAAGDTLQDVVFVYRQNKVEQRAVQLGIHNRDYIEILDGLEVGEAVVSGPYRAVAQQLQNNTPVTLTHH